MKPSMKSLFSVLKKSKLGLAGAALFVLAATMQTAVGNNSSFNPIVLKSSAPGLPKNYALYSAEWWAKIIELPTTDLSDGTPNHPLNDTTGGNCRTVIDLKTGDTVEWQPEGKVWFLVGGGNRNIRTCSIPQGKYVFFPLINVSCTKLEGPVPEPPATNFFGRNAKELRECTKDYMEDVDAKSLYVKIVPGFLTLEEIEELKTDKSVPNLPFYRVQSPPFKINVPNDSTTGFTNPNPYIPICEQTVEDLGLATKGDPNPPVCQSVSAGDYTMLAPLPPRQYTLIFGGIRGGNNQNNYFHLTVE